MTCVNCSTEGEGKFCANCGQRLKTTRLTWRESSEAFVATSYGFDGMFPHTFKDLTIRPGYVAMQYIRGVRIKYYGPVTYFFLMVTCFLLLLSIIGLNYIDYMDAVQSSMPLQAEDTKFNRDMRLFASDNLRLIMFMVIPAQAFVAQRLFFRKQGLNFLEHSVLPLYVLGHFLWLQMIEVIYFNLFRAPISPALQGVAIALFMGFAYTSFITTQPKWKTFLKGFFVCLTGYFVLMFTIAIITFATIIIMGIIDPSSLDAIRPAKVK